MTTKSLFAIVKQGYEQLTPIQLEDIREFALTMTPAEINAMRSVTVEQLFESVRIESMVKQIRSVAADEGAQFVAPKMPGEITLLVLVWYHVNEFWLKLEEV